MARILTLFSCVLVFLPICYSQENLALNKPADQSGAYKGRGADRAVDGVTNRTSTNCATTNASSGTNAWWYVDLEEVYRVQNVTVYYRGDGHIAQRRRYSKLSIGPSLSNLTTCVEFGAEEPPDPGHFGCDLEGRFVRWERTGGQDTYLFTLCEVQVFGYKLIDCSLCPNGISCNDKTGCAKCPLGKLQPDCAQGCPQGTYGLNCSSTCSERCKSAAMCNPVNGHCTGGCQPWWADKKCDRAIENVALNKPAYESGVYKGRGADRAVDGVTSGLPTHCATTDGPPGTNAWWYVDLVNDYRVQNVTIYYRGDGSQVHRRKYSRLSIGPSLSDLTTCVEFDQQEPPDPSHFACDRLGRFVQWERTGGQQPQYMTLCEVQVSGIKWINCSLCPNGISCNNMTGCAKCPLGKLQPDCAQGCSQGTYGLNCSSPCSDRCKSAGICNLVNGRCTEGCQQWWAGDRCDAEIVLPMRTSETVRAGEATNHSVTISWKQITRLPNNLDAYFYKINYNSSMTDYVEGLTVNHNTEDINTADVTGLEAYTSYDFLVTPWRRMSGQEEAGTPYPVVTARTKCGYPDSPKKVAAARMNETEIETIKVSWKNVSDLTIRCAFLTKVSVEYRLGSTGAWTVQTADATSTEYTITPQYGETYEVRVTVVNNDNLASSSGVHTVLIPYPEGSETAVITAVVVTLVIVVAVVAVVVVVILLKKKKVPTANFQSEEIDHQEVNNSIRNPGFSSEEDFSKPPTPTNIRRPVELHSSGKPSKPKLRPSECDTGPVSLSELENYTAGKKMDMARFSAEYDTLPSSDPRLCVVAQTDENKLKNRFRNIYPYDHSRVLLTDGGDDYINATHITGYYKPREYIATQGHKSETVEALWRMVWQEGANRIVMVCNVQENGKQRCVQYWPKSVGNSFQCGDFTITTEAEETSADYTNRILSLAKGSESRTVRHYHFTSWEDKKLPVYGAMTLFSFHRKVHSTDMYSKGPLIVHCSAGVGRTGTFIAFDLLHNEARDEGQVDIYGCVTKLRQQRMFMVQTQEQYFFLHDALVDYTKCGETAYPCNNFERTYMQISRPSSHRSGPSELERQFKVLQELKAPNPSSGEGISEANMDKNRDISILPAENNRPYLSTPYKQGTDYINAVYVSSYKAHKHYVVTQMPLPDTIVDFWRLVQDQDCHTIVMLNTIDKADPTCVAYWPDESAPKQSYGPLEVELTQTNADNTHKSIVTRDFIVRRKGKMNTETKHVRQFQLLSWPSDRELPRVTDDLLTLMDMVLNWQQQQQESQEQHKQNQEPPHVLIHCMDGVSQSGLYCAASYVIDRMKVEQDIDAFLASNYVTRGRPQFISSQAQYTFLYQIAMECMSHYSDYANFQ